MTHKEIVSRSILYQNGDVVVYDFNTYAYLAVRHMHIKPTESSAPSTGKLLSDRERAIKYGPKHPDKKQPYKEPPF